MSEIIKKACSDEVICAESIPETKRSVLEWIKSHKKQLIIAGIGFGTLIAIILGMKNKDSLESLWASLAESIKDVHSNALPVVPITSPITEKTMPTRAYTPPTETFHVSGHIRTMAAGKHHSAEKAAEAAFLGIELLPNQTLVDSYTKCAA